MAQHCGLLVVVARLGWLPQTHTEDDLDDGEDYSVCLVSLSESSPTMPGMTSFPGGLVDLADVALARSNIPQGSDPTSLAVRVAAVRQTFEGAGMLFAGRPPPDFARTDLRQVLVREGPTAFSAFLDDWGINLRPYSLRPLVRFNVPATLAAEPTAGMNVEIFLEEVSDAHEVSFASRGDSAEVRRVQWLQPSRALRMYEAGSLALPVPHWYTLKLLQEYLPSVNDLRGALQTQLFKSLRRSYLTPHVQKRRSGEAAQSADADCDAESVWLTLQGDSEHPIDPGPPGARHRVLVRVQESRRLLEAKMLERGRSREWEGSSSRVTSGQQQQHARL